MPDGARGFLALYLTALTAMMVAHWLTWKDATNEERPKALGTEHGSRQATVDRRTPRGTDMSAGYLRKCVGKRRYVARRDAEAHRRAMVRAGLWRLDKTNTYRCSQCGGFHTGHIGNRNRGKN